MKGKGKSVKSEVPDCPLQFPDIASVDHTRECPKYSAILNRDEGDSIGVEELDPLQGDIETLLASLAKRMRVLENEIQVLVNWQDKKDKKPEPVPVAPVKRGKGASTFDGGKHGKKMKESGKSASVQGPGRPKSKKIPTPMETDVALSPKEPIPRVPKNDTPNRFWTSVEPYCTEVNNDDLKVLEEIIKSYDDDSEYYKIPPLGKHYSQKWAQEDLMEEQNEGSKITDRRKSPSSANSNDTMSILKRVDGEVEESSPFGPLTQRLVSALIEENIMSPVDDTSMTDITGKDPIEFNASMSPRTLAKQLNLGNTWNLERRIKRELEEHGILDGDEKPEEACNPDDEVLMELKRKMAELKTISQHNILSTRRLYKLAKDEIGRQDMRKKMAAADAEVMEAFRRINAAKAKKRTPTKKERDMATKALKERVAVIKLIDNLHQNN